MLFDRYVAVDWSANSTPKRGSDSIWIAVHDGAEVVSRNVATRAEAMAVLDGLLGDDERARTLVGVDASLGYPAGTAAALGVGEPPWAGTWRLLADEIVDDERNGNNRFAVASALNERIGAPPGPFWGCPPSAATPALTTTKPPPGALADTRLVERRLRSDGLRPHTPWQLLGAGAVGSQSLLAIARLERWRRRRRDRIEVWPFTTGLDPPQLAPGAVAIAEIWPSMLARPADDGRVRDHAQVEQTACWLAASDRCGELSTAFAPDLASPDREVVVAEEGWVLGVGVGRA